MWRCLTISVMEILLFWSFVPSHRCLLHCVWKQVTGTCVSVKTTFEISSNPTGISKKRKKIIVIGLFVCICSSRRLIWFSILSIDFFSCSCVVNLVCFCNFLPCWCVFSAVYVYAILMWSAYVLYQFPYETEGSYKSRCVRVVVLWVRILKAP